ncbi:MAG TPA: alpha-L-arabinofuranosidase C-terminal domain-containing protein [Blastocatellia bacterium]|nr:alpha-L-arabinofuranosidase C-terminal domain-containing protein [Blastocatellia bacterium]
MKRRQFMKSAMSGSAMFLAGRGGVARLAIARAAAQSRSADSRIEVLLNEPIARIAPEIYGHFAEHLGGVVYDGIWVGEDSRIPNVGGIRKSLVDSLQRVKPSVVRWPGGCFADSYNWRDGVGPKSQRPRRTNFWRDAPEWPKGVPDGPWNYDTNQFGTNEFMRFCRLIGAQPYVAANVRSLTARDFYEWVEYCNSPSGTTSLADLRAAGGEREPFKVRYWGVGNESWGCGGNFTPEEYAAEYRRFTEWIPRYGVEPAFIGAGPNGGDLEWTRRFFTKMNERRALGRMWGWALHHYSWNVSGGRTTDWRQGKGDALKYPADEWYELLREAERMESLITGHWSVMSETDRQHRVKLVVDEWGSWYRPGTEAHSTHLLGQQSTMRDAVLAALTLNTFNRHADKVAMANVAQLINCLQSLFLASEDKFVTTPTFHVFEMYAGHQGRQSVRTVCTAPRSSYTRNGQQATIPGLSESASLSERQLLLTMANPDMLQGRLVEIAIRGANVKSIKSTVLVARDIHAHNSFETPGNVEPVETQAGIQRGGTVVHELAPASVTRILMVLE